MCMVSWRRNLPRFLQSCLPALLVMGLIAGVPNRLSANEGPLPEEPTEGVTVSDDQEVTPPVKPQAAPEEDELVEEDAAIEEEDETADETGEAIEEQDSVESAADEPMTEEVAEEDSAVKQEPTPAKIPREELAPLDETETPHSETPESAAPKTLVEPATPQPIAAPPTISPAVPNKFYEAEETTAPTRPAVEGASFRGILPGKTTTAQLEAEWGPAKELRKNGDTVQSIYYMEPFKQVVVSVVDSKVDTILIHLKKR